MPNPLYPGADWNPGANAGYARGKTQMRWVKAHFTVGRDSTGIGLQGYFQFLISRDGYVQQMAEADSLCFDSGEWNVTGPGIEIEYLPGVDDAIFTDAARESCKRLVHWLHDEWGIPLDYYHGPRIPVTAPGSGFIAHGSLIQTEQHVDFWPDDDWAQMVSGSPVPPTVHPDSGDDMISIAWNPRRLKLVAMAPNAAGQVFFSEQSIDGTWTAWTEVAQGSFALPVRQL